jgi:hypothetical protein
MYSAKKGKHTIIKGLDAYTEPVHPQLSQHAQRLTRGRTRVHFDRSFGVPGNGEAPADLAKKSLDLVRRQQ